MRRERGHGLTLALLVLVLMMTALGLVASSMRRTMEEDRREVRTVSLIALTDAALAETLAFLAEDESFRGVEEHPFGRGLISSEVRPLSSRRVEILARAAYGGLDRTARAQVQLTGGGPVVTAWQRAE